MRDHLDERALENQSARRAPQAKQDTEANSPVAHPGRATRQLGASDVLRLQRSIGNAGTTAHLQRERDEERSPVHETIARSGSPLDATTRSTMEQHHGTDFSDVRVHFDAKSAESVQASAYTVGNNIVLHPAHYEAGSVAAQRTLAHELTHVKQQRSGPVEGTEAPGGVRISTPSDRFEQEAEKSAGAFVAGNGAHGSSLSTRRQEEASEEPAVSRLSLQRQAELDEEEPEQL